MYICIRIDIYIYKYIYIHFLLIQMLQEGPINAASTVAQEGYVCT